MNRLILAALIAALTACSPSAAQQARRIAAVVKRLSKLKNPKSVEYLRGSKMIDLSPGQVPEGDEK